VLTADELGEVIEAGRRSLFRLEILGRYEVATDGSDYRRWLDGEPEPTWSRKQPWLDYLRREAAGGRRRQRVRVIHDPPTDYERFACEWGYALNTQAGEEVRVLDLAQTELPQEALAISRDFWLIDDERVVLMHYGDDATFLGAELLEPGEAVPYRAAREAAWRAATDFGPWWAANPRFHGDKPASSTERTR
jgi:hypothetical protein